MTNFNFLVSSAGRRGALVALLKETCSSLGGGQVIAADITTRAAARYLADTALTVPRCDDPQFVDHLLRICKDNRVHAVIPTIDPELPIWAAAKERFEAIGTRVWTSSESAIAIACDKDRTHTWLGEQGFPTVQQTSPEVVRNNRELWPFPLLVKPRQGSSAIGVQIVNTLAEMDVAVAAGDFLVQTIAPGEEYTVDIMVGVDGKARCAVPRRRLEVRAGEVSKGLTVRQPHLQELALRVGNALPGAFGVMNVQIFLDTASGEMNIIEINARFGGGFPLTWQAGGKYPLWLAQQSLGLEPTIADNDWDDRLMMLRYDDAVFVREHP